MKGLSKNWQIQKKTPLSFLKERKEISSFLAQILYNRGILNKEEIFSFLNPDYKKNLHSPFLFADMKKAVLRILEAVKKKEKILIWGDYDVDGICATAILLEVLNFLGAENLDFYIPEKEKEGYGLSSNTLKEKAKEKINLIITCDCGISAEKEIKEAKKLGIDVIITDHHISPSVIPPALAILNPKIKNSPYPFSELSGSGVAFKLAQGLIEEKLGKKDEKGEIFLKWLLDLVALGTLADVVPLISENRVLSKFGLIVLRKTQREGLNLLYRISGVEKEGLSTSDIIYRIIPRLNAAGRMAHGEIALNLLLEKNPEKAAFLAFELDKLNEQRQKVTERVLKEARGKIREIKQGQKILIVEGEGWPVGILGVVAGRLKDEYGMPVLVFNKENGIHTGSARSVDGFDITEALADFDDLLIRFGGHKKAAGLSLPEELFENFYENLHDLAKKKLSSFNLIPTLHIDLEFSFSDLTPVLISEIKKLEPFGLLNPRPIFLTKSILVKEKRSFGSKKQHLKLILKDKNIIKEAVGFGLGFQDDFKKGEIIDIVWTPEENYLEENIDIKILDIKKAKN